MNVSLMAHCCPNCAAPRAMIDSVVYDVMIDPRNAIASYRLVGEQCAKCKHVFGGPKIDELMLNIDERRMQFDYTNWKGEHGTRLVKPISIRFGVSEWHKKPQWLLTAYDFDKRDTREFAMSDMESVQYL